MRLSETNLNQNIPFIKADDLASESSPFEITGARSRPGQFGQQVAFNIRLFSGAEYQLTLSETEQRLRYVEFFRAHPGETIENLELVSVKTKSGQDAWVFQDFDGNDASDVPF